MSSGAALAAVAKAAKEKTPEAAEDVKEAGQVAGQAGGAATEEETETEVDVDKLSGAELDALVVEYEIQTPEGWAKFKVGEKRSWLKAQFEDDGAADTAAVGEEPKEVAVDTEAQEWKKAEATGTSSDPKPETAEEPAPAALTPAQQKKADKAAEKAAKAAPAAAPAPAPSATGTALATVAKANPPKGGKKGQAAVKALVGELLPAESDMIADTVYLIENLQEADARDTVLRVVNKAEFSRFQLGGILSVIQTKGWFQPYASFKEYVEQAVGIEYRKATYWTRMYNDLANSGIAWEAIKDVPWTKLKEISGILTKENVAHWVEIASTNTTLQLIELVRAHRNSLAGKTSEIESGAGKMVTTFTLKLHEDQKKTLKEAISKAKEVTGTDSADTVAMEHIALDYLNNAPDLTQILRKQGIEKALEIFDAAFPDAKLTLDTADGVNEETATDEAA